MAPDNDDDRRWDEDPLVRALRAPGTPEELSGEADFAAAFRAHHVRGGSVGRVVGRIGIGAVTAVTAVALSAGVAAAAYTQVLPAPVQQFAHTMFSHVGVPDSKPRQASRQAQARATTAPTPTPTPTPTHAPTPTPSRRTHPGKRPSATPSVVVTPTGPVSTPTSTPTDPVTPVTTPPPPPTPRVPATVTASASSHKVAAGASVTVTGVVADRDGHLLRKRVVRLVAKSGGGTWAKVATGTTDTAGRVSLESPPITETTRFRLVTGKGVHSAVVTVVVAPTLNAGVAEASGSSTITVTAPGAQPGDTVTVFRGQGKQLTRVGTVVLDSNLSAVLTVPTPRHRVRIVLRLPATKQHAAAQTSAHLGG